MATKKTGSLKGTDVVLITSVNLAADVGASVLPVANGGTGTGTWTDGQIAIGNTTGNTLVKTTLTGTSNQVVVTNGAGAITLSLPQSIDTAASPIFAQLIVRADGGTGITASRYSTNTGGPNFTLQKAGGTIASPLDAAAGYVAFNMLAQAYQASAFRTIANLQARCAAGFGTSGSDSPGVWAFQTTPDGSATQRDVVLFDDAGNVQFVVAGTLNAAAVDVVSLVGVDRINTRHAAAGNRVLAFQSERGSPIYLGDDAIDFAAITGVISVAGSDLISLTASSVAVSSAFTARSSLTLGVSSTTTGSLVLCGSGGANTHTIKAAAIPAATNSYVWPSASPTASQVLTASAPATGVVTLSWATNGVGDVVGPASSVTGAASVFSGTTGKLLRASPTVTYYSVSAGAEDKIEFGATFKDFRTATDGATVTFDLDLSDQWQVTFAGNRTLAVSNASIGQVITILRYQDATGSRTPTWWANIAWDNGLAPVDDPTASGWSMTVLACVGLDAYSVPNWKEVCRSTSAPLTGITTATDGATVTFDLRVSPRQKVTLAGNRTLALTSGSYYVGQTFDIKLTQDATGSRTVTWWSAIKWTGGTIPTLTTTAGKSDWFRFICTDASGSPKFDILGTSMNLGA